MTPLSLSQQRLWIIEQTGLGGAAYNDPIVFRYRGRLDIPAMRSAVADVARHHEVLRSRFTAADGEPRVSYSEEPAPFAVSRIAAADPEERRIAVNRLVEQEITRPFDLAKEVPLRTLVVSSGADEYVVVLNMHHIVVDTWSKDIIRHDLMASYRGWCTGQPVPPGPRQLAYADYAVWQREKLATGQYDEDIRFWRGERAEVPQTLDLPFVRPRSTRRDLRGGSVSAVLPASLVASVEALARSTGTTSSLVYHACWAVLLGRYSGQREFLSGMLDPGRDRAEFSRVVGLFENVMMVRVDLSRNPSFARLVDAIAHRANPAFAPAEQPVQVLFSYREDVSRWPGHDDPAVEPADMSLTLAKFDLELRITASSGDPATADLNYAADLFDAETAHQMMRHFVRLCELIGANAELPVDGIPLLTEDERSALIAAASPPLVASADTAHGLFERQVQQTPDAPAVYWEGRMTSYRQLDQAANRLAWYLRVKGIGPETPVGLCLARDQLTLTALFAILKAGGAYVPLDPALPQARLSFLLGDSAVPVVVTQSQFTHLLAGYEGQVVSLDDEADVISGYPVSKPPEQAEPHHMAYILYTSGSTGDPKGVIVEHRNVTNLAAYYRDRLSYAEIAGVLAATPLGFDASVLEIFAALPNGGCLILVDSLFSVLALASPVPVTLIQTVPSMMYELLKSCPLPDSVITVCLGGEATTGSLVDQVYAAGPVERVYNIYGPTEDTADTAWSAVPPGTEYPAIGRPLPGKRCYVLDANRQLVPRGVAGELYVAGPGVARGYLHRDKLTQERFLPDPFYPGPGRRMYRTGDRVRLRSSGELEYLGRMDRQVKLRGARIEPGEIEQVLRELPQVAHAVVIVAADPSGVPRLVAYVIPQGSWDEPHVRTVVNDRLPRNMNPEAYVVLDALPITVNGKLDTSALPVPWE